MRILTGIQPSGSPHLGNYFGMMQPTLKLAESAETFIFIADLHALTSVHDAQKLKQSTLEVAIDFLALGLDPEKVVFYRQSAIQGHTELSWILSTLTPVGLLERAHSYKDKVAKGLEANAGLFTYPVLMASDILLYDAQAVPVGRDQKQHLEITRDLAQKFNHQFGETFILPEGKIPPETAVVPGLDGQKMSKSYNNTIEIFASDGEVIKKVKAIVTDSKGIDEAKDPESPLVKIAELFLSPEKIAEYLKGGVGNGDFKETLAEAINTYFAPYKSLRAALAKDQDQVKEILQKGAEKAQAIATKKLQEVKKQVGLL
jgi:tryptophanyl-tRNA synthetase